VQAGVEQGTSRPRPQENTLAKRSGPRDGTEFTIGSKKYSLSNSLDFTKTAITLEPLDGFSKTLHARVVLAKPVLLSHGRRRSDHKNSQSDFCTFSAEKWSEVVAQLESFCFGFGEFAKFLNYG
jgi:hypothetical protein